MAKKKSRFILEPIEPKETRFIADRTKDKKEVEVGENSYTIIPLTPLLRQRMFAESDKRAKAKVPVMESFGWTPEKAAEYLRAHIKPVKDRTDEEQSLVYRYLRDDLKASELTRKDVDEGLAFEILDECIVSVNGEAPEECNLSWEDVYTLLGHIEDHSHIDESDKLAL